MVVIFPPSFPPPRKDKEQFRRVFYLVEGSSVLRYIRFFSSWAFLRVPAFSHNNRRVLFSPEGCFLSTC